MEMHIYVYKRNEHDRYYRRVKTLVDAYGPENTKILARTRRDDIASDITING
jgi:hypothetical protein